MSINKLAVNCARYLTIKLQKSDSYPEEILVYGLELIFIGIIGFLAVIAGGFLVGAPAETVVALFAASLLRLPGGGKHLSSPFKCIVFTVLIFSTMGFICLLLSLSFLNKVYILYIVISSGFFSLLISILYTPVINPEKPIKSPVLRHKLHLMAIFVSIIVPLILLFMLRRWPSLSFSGAVGLTWQSLMILLARIINLREVKTCSSA